MRKKSSGSFMCLVLVLCLFVEVCGGFSVFVEILCVFVEILCVFVEVFVYLWRFLCICGSL